MTPSRFRTLVKCTYSRTGYFHAEGGPAVEYSDGSAEWWHNGNLHRIGGPAVYGPTTQDEYYVQSTRLSEEEYYCYVDQQTGEIFIPPGKRLIYEENANL